MYEAGIPEFSFRKTGVCNVITKKIFAKYVLNSDLRPQMCDRMAASRGTNDSERINDELTQSFTYVNST